MPKNDNMLAILWMLSSNRKITAKHISEKLELNIRTVYRYIDALITSGVPIVSDSGHNGGYSLINDFYQAPLVFDIEEKKALLYATTHARDSYYPFSDALTRAIDKLRLYSTQEQEGILNRHIEGFEVAKQQLAPDIKALLEALTNATANNQSIEIEYRNKTEEKPLSRIIDPYGILHWCGKWYVIGFCQLREEIIGNINKAIDWAVRNDVHVVYIRHENLSTGTRTFKTGTYGAELVLDMKLVSENVFTKYKSNALTSEEFAEFISKNKIVDVYIAGVDAAVCVKSRCFNMCKVNLRVNVISDCITSYDKRKIEEMLEYYQSKGSKIITLIDL